MTEYLWMSPWGESWNLTTGDRGVRIEQGGYEDLPRSRVQRQGTEVAGRAGHLPTELVIPPAGGSFTVNCFASGAMSAGEVESRFKSAFSHHDAGFLVVGGWPAGDLRLRAELVEFSAPTRQPEHGAFTRLTVSIHAPDGLYLQGHSGVGVVDVHNPGDDVIFPRVRWREGGELVVPSGAVIDLPEIEGERTLVLDPVESCVVVDDDGQVDDALWGSFAVFPEGVPVGEGRTYRLPDGAVLVWDVGYTNPWK